MLPPPNALPIPELDCLLEPVLLNGVKHEILRSNAVVVNATAIDLELAFVDAPDSPTPRSDDLATDACYETERWIPMRGWAPVSQRYSWGPGLRHTSASFPAFVVPGGWEWDGAWRVWQGNANTDEDGWWYSTDLSTLGCGGWLWVLVVCWRVLVVCWWVLMGGDGVLAGVGGCWWCGGGCWWVLV